ncbi:MAG: M48 family metallopeptidase [Bacteroidales bacterium]|nr:M48 family metallopeptidase [Bacteroidales bacterium]MCF8391952.1 M48 family metallopeptidase [Bacteroidales bacterium]
MNTERRLFFNEIGEVVVKKRRGSKRMSIRVNPEGEVKITIPFFVSFIDAEKFLISRVNWIKESRIKMEEKRPPKIIYTPDNIPPSFHHEFIITRTKRAACFRKFSSGLCEIFIPETESVSSDKSQKYISESILATLRKEANIILINRTRELARMHKFSIKEIRVKNMKSRWGSCSSKNNINLNLHLMRLPKHLSDYVILHELVHTVHHNHSQKFWDKLDTYVEDSKTLAKELKKWSTN